ncbi:MAG: DUF262 domain-containing HNH endonuclease family protein [Oscillospiraceae bacterium]|nr:DUF262 domain-containing HNH endonuclease family protein [Oscillospiraceae bacterium]
MAITEGKSNIKSLFIEDRYFEVPNYQRSYAWGEKQLKDFIDDFSHIENYQNYYYGTILFQQKENCDDSYDIVDGQQRLTTLIIFTSCLAARYEKLGQTETADEIRKKYVKYKTNFILKLQEQDDGFFKSYVLTDNDGKAIKKTPAQTNLLYAKNFFRDKLDAFDIANCEKIYKRIQLANCLVYSVTNRNEAAMIFETTNDRGKVLTNLEKTKSFLMYKASASLKKSDSLLNTIQQSFFDIYTTYEALKSNKKFNLDESSLQQYMFIAYEKWFNRKNYKAYQHYMTELKIKINTLAEEIYDSENDREEKEKKEEVFNNYIVTYVSNLKESFDAVNAMFACNGYFRNLIALGRMASIYPVLIKAYWLDKSENKEEFDELCRYCEIFCYRGLAILKNQSNKFMTQWYDLARDFDGDFSALYNSVKVLILQLGDDEKFFDRIKSRDFYREYYPQDRNYFFWSYENALREKNGYAPLTFNDLWEEDYKKRLTIEHIVAQNDAKDKCRILKDEKYIATSYRSIFDREYLHSVGNLAIDPQSANSSKGKKEVEEKNSRYFVKAPLMSQNELETFLVNGKWTKESIELRRDIIVKFAKDKWCFEMDKAAIVPIPEEDDDNDGQIIE